MKNQRWINCMYTACFYAKVIIPQAAILEQFCHSIQTQCGRLQAQKRKTRPWSALDRCCHRCQSAGILARTEPQCTSAPPLHTSRCVPSSPTHVGCCPKSPTPTSQTEVAQGRTRPANAPGGYARKHWTVVRVRDEECAVQLGV